MIEFVVYSASVLVAFGLGLKAGRKAERAAWLGPDLDPSSVERVSPPPQRKLTNRQRVRKLRRLRRQAKQREAGTVKPPQT